MFSLRSWIAKGGMLGLFIFVNLFLGAPSAQPKTMTVRLQRWLEIRAIAGQVQRLSGGRSEAAQVGQRLAKVGEGLRTGPKSKATLAIDSGIGFVQVGENAEFEIQQLQVVQGGMQTQLKVIRGQVRLKVRPFTHPKSNIRINTPAGVAGVRGTEFGVGVNPSGKTGIATLEGAVVASAQGREVDVAKGYQSVIPVGLPPKPAVPLRDDPSLDLQLLLADGSTVQLMGQTDEVNVVTIGNQILEPDSDGTITFQGLLPADRQLAVTITTPLGKTRDYNLRIP